MAGRLDVYWAAREALIKDDRSLRLDRIQGDATLAEIKADQVLRKIRAEEARSVWDADHPSVPHPFPGMEFLTGQWRVSEFFCAYFLPGKKIIVQTKLFTLLSKVSVRS
jgi:adenosine deaminase CECR1